MSILTKYSPTLILSAFWLLALLNPVFKKFDYGAEWPMVIVLGVLCAVMFWTVRNRKIYDDKFVIWEKIFAAGFLVFYLVSFVFSETRNVGFNEFVAFACCFSVYFIFAHREDCGLLKFLKVVGIGTVIACVVGFGIYLFKDEPSRMIGPFFNIFYASNLWPNAFALFLLIASPILLFLAYISSGARRFFWLTGLAFGLASLFLTYSRGALLVGIFELILVAGFFIRKINFSVIAKVFYVGLISIILIFSANYIREIKFNNVVSIEEKIVFANHESSTSVKERYDFWKGALNMSLEKPFTGYGPYSFRYVYGATQQKDLLAIADHPHNVFLKISAENGLIAIGFFFLFLMTVFLSFLFGFKKIKSYDEKVLAYLIFVSIVGAFAHNMIDYNFNFLANILLVFALMALLRSIIVQNSYSIFKEPDSSSNFLLSVMTAVLLTVSLYEGGMLVLSKIYYEDFREKTLYPRDYFSNKVAEAYENKYEFLATSYAYEQLDLNRYDADTLNLIGAMNLENESKRALNVANEYFSTAIEMNPYNDFKYYANKYQTLKALEMEDELNDFEDEVEPLLRTYLPLAENNVHFTAYTKSADAAAYLYEEIFDSDKLLRIIEKQRASRK